MLAEMVQHFMHATCSGANEMLMDLGAVEIWGQMISLVMLSVRHKDAGDMTR